LSEIINRKHQSKTVNATTKSSLKCRIRPSMCEGTSQHLNGLQMTREIVTNQTINRERTIQATGTD